MQTSRGTSCNTRRQHFLAAAKQKHTQKKDTLETTTKLLGIQQSVAASIDSMKAQSRFYEFA